MISLKKTDRHNSPGGSFCLWPERLAFGKGRASKSTWAIMKFEVAAGNMKMLQLGFHAKSPVQMRGARRKAGSTIANPRATKLMGRIRRAFGLHG